MIECNNCNSEINSIDDLLNLEGNKVCPYCFYIYDTNVDIDILKDNVDNFEDFINRITTRKMIKQLVSKKNDKDYTPTSLIFFLITLITLSIIIPFIFAFLNLI